ncbi:solute carrier family 22 member 6-like [Pararge aegeria]|uniref:solute carrier family 22 member 6-like n=1 Tax=Pararge aegeria TaxID=116150 RepID=UPI0019D21303|nr:solute carrier family 22 member 6-like [Pararge aegeria]
MVQRIISVQSTQIKKDDALANLIGHFGRWQFLVIATVSLVKLSSGWVQMAIIFLTPNLVYWCKDFGDNSSRVGENMTCYADCAEYGYDSAPFENTIITQWGLVCERTWMASFAQMVLQLGVLLGSVMFGFLSDSGDLESIELNIQDLISGYPYQTDHHPPVPNFRKMIQGKPFSAKLTEQHFVPAILTSVWLLKHIGRKAACATFLALGGLCVLTLGVIPDTFWMTLTLGCIGVSCVSIVCTCIYIYTSELFPTVVRNMGMGACSTSMRVGSMIAPFVSDLSKTVPWMPTVIFGLAPLVGALVCLLLPETKGTALPDSIKDVKDSA